MNLDNFEIVLCPTVDQAKEQNADITIEAEYGNFCVEGNTLTLAHHGDRSDNPAPCNTDVQPLEGGKIVISHLDLDTVGGIMAVTGDKREDPDFWHGAEVIDVQGVHHMHDLSQDVQDKLNAVYAWNASQERVRYDSPTDVKEVVRENYNFLEKVLDRNNPEHEQVLEKGRKWARDIEKVTEDRCVKESPNLRAFKTEDPFCSASYYSPTQDQIIPVTVSFNSKFNSISIAFADGGREQGGMYSAKEMVQSLWGAEAGGRDGIAGSPRGWQMTEKDFERAIELVDKTISIERVAKEVIQPDSDRNLNLENERIHGDTEKILENLGNIANDINRSDEDRVAATALISTASFSEWVHTIEKAEDDPYEGYTKEERAEAERSLQESYRDNNHVDLHIDKALDKFDDYKSLLDDGRTHSIEIGGQFSYPSLYNDYITERQMATREFSMNAITKEQERENVGYLGENPDIYSAKLAEYGKELHQPITTGSDLKSCTDKDLDILEAREAKEHEINMHVIDKGDKYIVVDSPEYQVDKMPYSEQKFTHSVCIEKGENDKDISVNIKCSPHNDKSIDKIMRDLPAGTERDGNNVTIHCENKGDKEQMQDKLFSTIDKVSKETDIDIDKTKDRDKEISIGDR